LDELFGSFGTITNIFWSSIKKWYLELRAVICWSMLSIWFRRYRQSQFCRFRYTILQILSTTNILYSTCICRFIAFDLVNKGHQWWHVSPHDSNIPQQEIIQPKTHVQFAQEFELSINPVKFYWNCISGITGVVRTNFKIKIMKGQKNQWTEKCWWKHN
jgi:hypothetical protein